MAFPKDFVWGAATSSYQIEGAAREDGRGECIWERFSHTPGKVSNGDTGAVACDHYHRYSDDVALMKQLGLRGYRFSVSWPRVLPNGTGATNPAGLDFYDRLVDEVLGAGIQPFLTLYHWDLPQALQDRGGWANPDSIGWFSEYADLVSHKLGDRVKRWITLNEPWVIAFLGNLMGIHAPGNTDVELAYRVAHNLLLAHGQAVPVIRGNTSDSQVGITVDLGYFDAATDSEADQQAAWREDGFKNRWFLDPLFKGTYPADMVDWLGTALNGIDLSAVQAATVPIDFLGINYYARMVVGASNDGLLKSQGMPPADGQYTGMGWEIYPEGLRRLLVRLHEEYGAKALYVTENGAAFDDPPPQNGTVDDPQRTAYLEGHFAAAQAAIEQGAPLKGYFVWSLLDNFEWSFGYDKRFGMVHVDFATQQRTLKRSARWYQQKIRAETT